MNGTMLTKLGMTLVAGSMLVPLACKRPSSRTGHRTVKASVAEFNPSELSFDLSRFGTARVDDFAVQEAFQRSFDGLDACVVMTKERRGVSEATQLDGEVEFEVQLDPQSPKPMGVNARISSTSWDRDRELKDCLRLAVANAGFPTYDGPPQLASFQTQLDPGSTYVEDDWW